MVGLPPVVGREAELARIDAFVGAVESGARMLVISGEPGIGKTTLWRAGVERCRRAGFRVLQARPAAEEMPLVLGALVDLFERVELDVSIEDENDPVARGYAVLGALRSQAEHEPTVVAIDDLHWLDPASAHALRFALRRLDPERIGVRGALRTPQVGVGLLAFAAADVAHLEAIAGKPQPDRMAEAIAIEDETGGASLNRRARASCSASSFAGRETSRLGQPPRPGRPWISCSSAPHG